MAGRRRNDGTGLLTMVIMRILAVLLSLLIPVSVVSAQDPGQPQITMYGTQDRPVAGSTWVLTLLIAHSEPNEVEVLAPHFTGSLLLDQVLKGPRFRNPATGQTFSSYPQPQPAVEGAETGRNPAVQEASFERWTAMEYRFVLNSPGTISFDSFTVITPLGQVKTSPFDLSVLSPPNTAETKRYQMAWEETPPGLITGESAVFNLQVKDWNSAVQMPETMLFLPPVPQGFILESLPVSVEENISGLALRLRLVPLSTVPFTLEKRQFVHNGSAFEIPALQIPVSRAAAANFMYAAPAEAATGGSAPPPPFPALQIAAADNARLYQKYQTEYESIHQTVMNLWDRGYRANALATLRQNERDHPAGMLFAAVRREAEKSLGFSGTGDEKKRNPLLFFMRKPQTAVLRETAVRHIPDSAGEVTGRFKEGQPVFISSFSSPSSGRREIWMRVTANDSSGATGWAPEESIIFY